jgi:pSer/pThr/pTyr-binding forkhead associated (FHA) protein
MSFAIQRTSGSSTAVQQIDTDILRIGRGTNCELRSDNPAVALVHAEIRAGLRDYTIVDKGSVTGTYVNRKPVEWATLAKGDEIEIGDLRIQVQLAEPEKPLFLQVSPLSVPEAGGAPAAEVPVEPEAMALGGTVRARRIDYASAYGLRRPYLTKLALACLLLIVALLVMGELLLENRQSLVMPGALSSAHSLARDQNGDSIAKNCSACHDPWRSVSNAKCTACHARAPHAERQAETPACVFCHREHSGQPKLALIRDARCLSCHGDLRRHVTGTGPPVAAHVRGFGVEHPEFQPIADPGTLRISHKKHLKSTGILTTDGKHEVLTCASCHKLISRGTVIDPAPLDFNRDCHRCHSLTFDETLPSTEVPHGGDPHAVYGFIMVTYSSSGGSQESAARAIKTADDLINTTCRECHKIEKRGDRLSVVPTSLPAVWLEHAKFTHTSHRGIECTSCHKGAPTSTKATDNLIPQQETCKRCHGPQTVRLATTCATCHVYHERSKLSLARADQGTPRAVAPPSPPLSKRAAQMLEMVLTSLVVILMLVVLIPVGMAFYGYLKARWTPSPKPPAAPAPEPSKPSLPVSTTNPEGKIDKPRAASSTDQTPAPTSTELVQWFGMLHCTSGPLAGQRFIVPEEGLWIGRDSTLSQIVVDDPRVSKRHVRIVPRAGHVHAIDTESRNGTFIEKAGQRITDVELKRGSTIILGDDVATFVYEV